MHNVPGWDGDGICITALLESDAIPYESTVWDLSEDLKKPLDRDATVIYRVSPPKNKKEADRLADAAMYARHYGVRLLLTGKMKDYPARVRANIDTEEDLTGHGSLA